MNSKFNQSSNLLKKIIWALIIVVIAIFIINLYYGKIPDYIDENFFKDVLIMTISVSATILTIVFALSQIILQSSSENISSSINEYENDNSVIQFYSVEIILIIVSFIVLCLVTSNFTLPNGNSQLEFNGVNLTVFIFVFIIVLFLLSLISLIKFTNLMFLYSNPLNYSNYKFQSIENKLSLKKLENEDINSIGANLSIVADISIKAMNRGEIFTVKTILKNFFDNIWIANFDSKASNVVFLNTLREIYRIFKKSIEIKDFESTNEIIIGLRSISYKILKNNYQDMIFILYGDDIAFSDDYEVCGFFEPADIHTSEFNFHSFLKLYLSRKEEGIISLEYVVNHVEIVEVDDSTDWNGVFKCIIFNIFKSVIEKDDFLMFEDMIEDLTYSKEFKKPSETISELLVVANSLKNEHDDEIEIIINEINTLLNDFDYKKSISIVQNLFKINKEENFYLSGYSFLTGNIKDFCQYMNNFQISVRIYKEFFVLGAFILYNFHKTNEYKKATKYIGQIWNPLKPHITSTHYIHGSIIDFNELFLFNIYIFGGINKENWQSMYIVDRGNDIDEYINLYFILVFINSIKYDNYENREHYILIQKIISKKDSLFKTIDRFKNVFDIWYDLIEDKLTTEDFKESIWTSDFVKDESNKISLKDPVENYSYLAFKVFIEKRFNELAKIELDILKKLDLDEDRMNIVLKGFSDNYTKCHESSILDSFKSKLNNNLLDGEKLIFPIDIEKDILIKDSIVSPNITPHDCGLVLAEEAFILKKVKSSNEVHIIDRDATEENLEQEIIDSVQSMKKMGLEPNLIIIPYIPSNMKNEFFKEILRNRKFEKEDISLSVELNQTIIDEIFIIDTTKIEIEYQEYNEKNVDKHLSIKLNKENVFIYNNDNPNIKIELNSKIKFISKKDNYVSLIKFKPKN